MTLLTLREEDWVELGLVDSGSRDQVKKSVEKLKAASLADKTYQKFYRKAHDRMADGRFNDMWEYCSSSPSRRKECHQHTPFIAGGPRLAIYYADRIMDEDETKQGGFPHPHEDIGWVQWLLCPHLWIYNNSGEMFYGLPFTHIACCCMSILFQVSTPALPRRPRNAAGATLPVLRCRCHCAAGATALPGATTLPVMLRCQRNTARRTAATAVLRCRRNAGTCVGQAQCRG